MELCDIIFLTSFFHLAESLFNIKQLFTLLGGGGVEGPHLNQVVIASGSTSGGHF